jgi:hypothetical protein
MRGGSLFNLTWSWKPGFRTWVIQVLLKLWGENNTDKTV